MTGNEGSTDLEVARDLAWAFADIVNRQALAELHDIFEPDGALLLPGGLRLEGPGAIAAKLGELLANHQKLVHMVFSGRVHRVDAGLVARWYIAEVAPGTDGVTRWFQGVYHDDIALGPDGPRFRSRRYDALVRLEGRIDGAGLPFPADLAEWPLT